GLERIFTHIAASVDQNEPAGSDWHRELLRQMTIALPGIRPAVLSMTTAEDVDEYLRLRHMVRHIYAFQLDTERVDRLAGRLPPIVRAIDAELGAFAPLLEGWAREG
ncbi:MAG TPA: hypothetical protein VFX03_15640, partial [Thermomicrobiales bacterium]|nr:hypothetical protein [Thermomicrobiales bacterium]